MDGDGDSVLDAFEGLHIGTTDEQKIGQFLQELSSPDAKMRCDGVSDIRKILSRENNPPIQIVLDSGVLEILVQIMEEPINPANEYLMFQTVWALTNIASGTSEHVTALCDANVIPLVLRVMHFEGNFEALADNRRQLIEQGNTSWRICCIYYASPFLSPSLYISNISLFNCLYIYIYIYSNLDVCQCNWRLCESAGLYVRNRLC